MSKAKSKDAARGRGRPRKSEGQKASASLFVRGTPELKAAILQFQTNNGIISESEAVRQLLLRALKAEGLI
jgi:hypothetical protein